MLDPGDGTLWLTLEGMIEELWSARTSIVFKPLGRMIDVDDCSAIRSSMTWPTAVSPRLAKKTMTQQPRNSRDVMEDP